MRSQPHPASTQPWATTDASSHHYHHQGSAQGSRWLPLSALTTLTMLTTLLLCSIAACGPSQIDDKEVPMPSDQHSASQPQEEKQESEARSRWNQRFSGSDFLYGESPSPWLVSVVEDLPKGKALDIAAGEGRNTVFLALAGFEATAIDISAVGLKKAEQLAAKAGVAIETRVADLETWSPGTERWDLIADFYYTDRDLFPRLAEALNPGGRLVFEGFTTEHLVSGGGFGPRTEKFLLRPDEGREIAEEVGLQVLYYQEAIVELAEGMHQGPGAIVRMIAMKPMSAGDGKSP